MCFNTQPPEGGWAAPPPIWQSTSPNVFQHTAARRRLVSCVVITLLYPASFQHTAARRRLEPLPARPRQPSQFQHTAARRRLGSSSSMVSSSASFQHTAARRRLGGCWRRSFCLTNRFNTQPPEGGWPLLAVVGLLMQQCFNTQPTEGGWNI